ncbi:MAG: ABC transporter substrate-binding protein [Acinetobacter sp.]|nr:ABC transporter substrate-binding protein [Acinetobacter sp.]
MKTLIKHSAIAAGVLASLVSANQAFAAPAEAAPAFVKRVADQLIVRLKADAAKIKGNPSLARTIVRQNIEPYIDSQGFARLVMGTYAANNYSTAAQRATFENNFKNTLISNYGSALAKYANNTYTMRPYKASSSQYPVVTVDFLHQGEKIPVSFQLIDKNNQWKIRNVNVSGIDIGLQFRNQFADTVKRNGNNIDKAIANFKPDLDNK